MMSGTELAAFRESARRVPIIWNKGSAKLPDIPITPQKSWSDAKQAIQQAIRHLRRLPTMHKAKRRKTEHSVDVVLDSLLEGVISEETTCLLNEDVPVQELGGEEPQPHDKPDDDEMQEAMCFAQEAFDVALEHLASLKGCDSIVKHVDSKGLCSPSSIRKGLMMYPVAVTATTSERVKEDPEQGIDLITPQEEEQWDKQFRQLGPHNHPRKRTATYSRIPIRSTAMVDSGATRCFISTNMIKKFQLKTFKAQRPLRVMMADGEHLEAGRQVAVTLRFQEFTYTHAFFVLPLGIKASFVLGIPFLQAISPYQCDARNHEYCFEKSGKQVKMHPVPLPIPQYEESVISLEQALKDIRVLRKERKKVTKRNRKEDNAIGETGEPLAYLCRLIVAPEEHPEENQSIIHEAASAVSEVSPEEGMKSQLENNERNDLMNLMRVKPRQNTRICKWLADMAGKRATLGLDFWNMDRRNELGDIVRTDFKSHIKEELPIREGPDVDYTKTPATIRFKKDYAGQTPHRLGPKFAPAEMKQCREILLDLLAKGYIKPSASPFGSPVLMVPKPGCPGKLRMVIDYRAVNQLVEGDRYPLPTIEELIAQMSGAKIFSTLDMLSGFWQQPVLEEHKERTAMTTTLFGQFTWEVMPMGLKNSPAQFQRAMAEAVRDLPFVSCYIDDLIVFSTTVEEHMGHLRTVFERLKKVQMLVKESKMHLFKKSVNFLGHCVSGEGVAPQHAKISAIRDWPTPSTVAEVRSFLGLASFYRKYVYRFAAIATPLHHLLKDKAEWNWRREEEQRSFDLLKKALMSAPLLVLPDVEGAMSGRSPYLVQTDASEGAWGAVISQDQGNGPQPIAFASKTFSPAEVNYSATERELLGLVRATCFEWRHILWGAQYKLQGDHRPLQWLLDPSREISRRQARWLDLLGENNVPAMEWVPGKTLIVADALSRRPDHMAVIPSPREGLMDQSRPQNAAIIEDPKDTIIPSNPLREESYMLPEGLHSAPAAWKQQPELSKILVEKGETKRDDTSKPASIEQNSKIKRDEALDLGPQDRRILRAQLLTEAENLRSRELESAETLTIEGLLETAVPREETSWIPIYQQNGLVHCLPNKGTGSVPHATETLLLLSTTWREPQENEVPEYLSSTPNKVVPREICCYLENLERTLVTNNRATGIKPGELTEDHLDVDQYDWTFSFREFERLQKQLGPFAVDACCDPQGNNKQSVKGNMHWSDCLRERWDGLHVWVFPPFKATLISRILQHFKQCRNRDNKTAMTVVLPDCLTNKWTGLMTGYVPVRNYPKGTIVFFAPDGAMLPNKSPITVWHVAPAANSDDTEKLRGGDCVAITETKRKLCVTCGKGSGAQIGKVWPCIQCKRAFHQKCGKGKSKLCEPCRQSSERETEELEKNRPMSQDFDLLPVSKQLHLLDQLKKAAAKDPQYTSWMQVDEPKVFRKMGGLLWRVEGGGLQLVIPSDAHIKDQLLDSGHASASAGHMGQAKTYEKVSRRFWWPGMRKDVLSFVDHCDSCQRNKARRKAPPGSLLTPVPIPARRGEVVSMDFVTGIPTSEEGYNAIYTIIDKSSKLVRFVPLVFGDRQSSGEGVARLFVDHWWKHHGMPSKIISDRDVRFCSAFWTEFLRLTGSKASMTTSFHPQANGQAENTNQTMEMIIRAYVSNKQKDWPTHLAAAEFAINDSIHASTGFSPFQLTYGESPASHLDLFLQSAMQEETVGVTGNAQQQIKAAERFVENWRKNLAEARMNMERAQKAYKRNFDGNRKHVEYSMGDRLLVSQKHLTLPKDRDTPWKLRALYDGPYEVTKVLKNEEGKAFAYKLNLPAHLKQAPYNLHDIFSARKVVKYRGDSPWESQKQEECPEPVKVEGIREHFVEAITEHRDILCRGRTKKGQPRKTKREYLVKWVGLHAGHNQWRSLQKLNNGGENIIWREYEKNLYKQNPSSMIPEARHLITTTKNGLSPITASSKINPQVSEVSISSEDNSQTMNKPLRRSARINTETEQLHAAIEEYENNDRIVRNKKIRVLVLFSGTGSVEKVVKKLFPTATIISVDIDPKSKATCVQDIRIFATEDMFDYHPGQFTFIWASPPCTEYSRAMTGPRSRDLDGADELVSSALACIQYLKPRYWCIENPEGLLRTRPLMRPYRPYMKAASYCKYGSPVRKNTCLWTNLPLQEELHRCCKDTPCSTKRKHGKHLQTAQAGPAGDTPGSGPARNMYPIPEQLLRVLLSPTVLLTSDGLGHKQRREDM